MSSTENKAADENKALNVHCVNRYELSPFALLRLLTSGYMFTIESGIPKDAELRGAAYDSQRDMVIILAEHPSFTPHIEGEYIPATPITISSTPKHKPNRP